jgi:hypothetical protein
VQYIWKIFQGKVILGLQVPFLTCLFVLICILGAVVICKSPLLDTFRCVSVPLHLPSISKLNLPLSLRGSVSAIENDSISEDFVLAKGTSAIEHLENSLRQSFVHSTPKPDTQASAIYMEFFQGKVKTGSNSILFKRTVMK